MKKAVFLITTIVTVFFSACGDNGGKEAFSEYSSGSVSTPVTFAVFGNTGNMTDDGSTFDKLIRAVNEYDVDFTVNLGNNLPYGVHSSGIRSLLNSVDENLKQFDIPVYPVVGKNDVFDFKSDIEYTNRYGPIWYSFRRNGILFIVLNTEDEAYRFRFGNKPWIGDEQIEWLWNCLNEDKGYQTVLFINRPLWLDYPSLWNERLLPVLKAGNVNLIVTCFENGLFDWGKIDGIRAVSTGCTGPVKEKNPGLFPHVLLITVSGDETLFRVLFPDGTTREGIWIDSNSFNTLAKISAPFNLPLLKTDNSWQVNETLNLQFNNSFDMPMKGKLYFTVYPNTRWTVEPAKLDFSVAPGVSKTLRLGIRGIPPEYGPIPKYTAELNLGETVAYNVENSLKIKIPRPRTGDVVPISVKVPENILYPFDSNPLKIQVEIDNIDTCGRLIIYREGESDIPVCLHVSYLMDFKLGINEFVWDGRNLEGQRVMQGTLSYFLLIYNKQAPVTWVANGPSNNNGTFSVERTLSGLIANTHNDNSLISYRIASTMGVPKPEEIQSFSDVLDGMTLTGFARGERDRIFLGTDKGILCVYMLKGKVTPDVSFGEEGYVSFTDYRGRLIGNLSYHNGLVYVGIGGGVSGSPAIVVLDSVSGEKTAFIDLEEFFSGHSEPPSIYVNDSGIYCAHPDNDNVVMLTHYGHAQWLNEAGDMIGDRDSDGRSFTYGISADQYGFSYVNTPGTSARCGVLGPDGRGLFRVILVQLPGLRVSSVFPIIEGARTDGLYFVTRDGDVPYVFHVPFTIRKGKISDKFELMND